jgi:hypothetical protein
VPEACLKAIIKQGLGGSCRLYFGLPNKVLASSFHPWYSEKVAENVSRGGERPKNGSKELANGRVDLIM